MIPRYNERVGIRCPVILAGGNFIAEGHVLNLTAPGCLVTSLYSVERGQYLQLKMVLPGLQTPFHVALAVVRWTEGSQFGVEFIRMSAADQASLDLFLSRHLPQLLSRPKRRDALRERGGHRRHLERWTLSE